jgi:penicillin amidase
MIYLFLLLTSLSSFATSDIKCEATYDELKITRQKVNSIHDYYYCFGYHHGKDRAWMMDYFRRVATGRNAEVYGFSSLKSDLMMRLLNLPKLAKRLYKEMPMEQKGWLEAYARGATLGFVMGKESKEFKDLNYAPEDWKPEHSILVLVLQSFDQTRKTFFRDFEEEQLKEKWKNKTEELFNEENVPWLNTILKTGEYEVSDSKVKTTSVESSPKPRLWENFPEVFGKESGSNNWVINKAKSKNGFAMLANDPHLDLKTPLFWYWINIQSPDFNVIGGSVPGVPVVVSGTNGRVAWGLTNAYINTADAVFLKDYPKDYLVSFRPTVKVKLGFLKIPFFFKRFERTTDGDIVLPLDLENKNKIVLRWTGFQLGAKDLLPMFNLMHAKDVTGMDNNLKNVGLPAWNFVFADTKGDIGYRVVGHIYKDTGKDPYGISTETLKEFKSKKLLHPMERPHVLKPKRNYVYSANNRHWPADSKYYGGRGYSYSFRGFRIDELLKDSKHDVESFKNIQCDQQVVDARFFVDKLLRVVDIPEFKGWDFVAQNDKSATGVYRRLMDLLLVNWQVNEYALYKMLDELTDKQKSEVSSYYKLANKQVAGRSWGDFHRLTFSHLSKNTDWKFSPEIPGVGDKHSVNPGTSDWNTDKDYYEQYSGASMRMIIVMKETPEIHLALPGYNRLYTEPQEGTPSWNEWQACKYSKVSFK